MKFLRFSGLSFIILRSSGENTTTTRLFNSSAVLLRNLLSFLIIFLPRSLMVILIFLSISSLTASTDTLQLSSPILMRSVELLVRKERANAQRYMASMRLVLPCAFSPIIIFRLQSNSTSSSL